MANSFNAKKRDIEQAKKLLAEEPNNPDRLKNLTEKLVSAQLCLRSDWIILSGFPQETPNRNILLAKFREEAVKYWLKLPEDNIDKK